MSGAPAEGVNSPVDESTEYVVSVLEVDTYAKAGAFPLVFEPAPSEEPPQFASKPVHATRQATWYAISLFVRDTASILCNRATPRCEP